MHEPRNVTIKRKLTSVVMVVTNSAILVAGLFFIAYDLYVMANTMIEDIATTVVIIGDNSAAAVSSKDPVAATQMLKSLVTHTYIVGAAIYDKDGKVFAQYRNPAIKRPFTPPAAEPTGTHTDANYYRVFRDIKSAGKRIGTIYLQSELADIQARGARNFIVFLLVTLTASTIAFFLSTKMLAVVSAPISQLAAVAKQVATENNYSLRAIKHGEDELGNLIDDFNEMLNQIQQRDSALQEVRANLEKRVAERTQELASSLSLLNATIESSADGILAHEFAGGPICYNTQYLRLWNISSSLMQGGADDEKRIAWLAAQTKDPQHFLERIEYVKSHHDAELFDVIEMADGRILERYIRPQRINGEQTGVVVNIRDVTVRKRSEVELEQAHKQLVDISRQAGMAEVATGVLHNVGNVLNSVNVSANLVAETAKSSRVSGLAKVATLLREHQDDLGEFINTDAKGKHLPAYLTQLCEHLLTERLTMSKELEDLRNNIDHIKQIVSMQQTYSKVSGIKEVVDVIDLIEDTLRMNGGALQRHDVQLVRDFAAVPTITTEKHKILQILVNLIRNAKYACSDSGRTDKRLTIRVTHDDSHIRIAVKDNGIGIAPENLTRVFSHGFTTRKDGHGFGLHSGALAARELGGSLRAQSDGLGLGATFTLDLPINNAEPLNA